MSATIVTTTVEQLAALQHRIAVLEDMTANQRRDMNELMDKVDEHHDKYSKSMREVHKQFTKTMLPLVAAAHPTRMTCCFCMEDLSVDDDDLFLTPCGHVFHYGSWPAIERHGCRGVNGFMTEDPTCPFCRAKLPDLGI